MHNKSHAILIDHNQSPELNGFAGLAPFVKLGVRLKDAEEFFAIGEPTSRVSVGLGW